jgi:hypothetical protein
VKSIFCLVLLTLLSACSGLEVKSSKLEIGSSKAEVLQVMGAPNYPDLRDGVIAWRYGARADFGYCDYREFFIFKDKVIEMNQYYHSSVAGCTVGLQKIDWDPILAKAAELRGAQPQETSPTKKP